MVRAIRLGRFELLWLVAICDPPSVRADAVGRADGGVDVGGV